ncbi:TPA: restriction endonuclease subunit S [Klebsiella quasipneumoniae]|nr:restriction endonuclease subunit S [Klebsiella quasipneumoniae]
MSIVEQVPVLEKYQPYPEYKDSGVEWLGDVPSHWVTKKIAWHYTAKKGRNAQMLTKEFCGENKGNYPVYSGQTENDGVMGVIDSYEFDAGEGGYLFATTVGAKAMTLSLLKGKFSLSQNCMVIIPSTNVFLTKFAFYHCQPLFAYERGLIPEHMQASFRMEDLYQYRIAMPPHSEQRTIAAFLDYETARIDKLITKQQRLIELLKEKRQAVISHAVTKGLNPNAPMKDSGVEWLGDVPEHWVICQLSAVATKITNGYVGPTRDIFVESGVKYLQSLHIKNNKIDFHTPYFVSHEWSKSKSKSILKFGDVLIVQTGDIGQVACVQDGFVGANCHALIVVSPVNRLEGRYLSMLLNSGYGFHSLKSIQTGALHPHLNCSEVKTVKITIPSGDEQLAIVDYIHCQTSKIDCLISRSERMILLLKERHKTLISAAVSGKIDLRGWAAPTEEVIA